MLLKAMHCKICGGTLKLLNDGVYECEYNSMHRFKEDDVTAQQNKLKSVLGEAFTEQKEELIANLRYNLWTATHRENGNNDEVKKFCLKIKEYLPDDFQANFYLTAVTGSVAEVNKLISSVDADKEPVEDIIRFLLNPLEPEHVLAISYLIQRAFARGEEVDPRYEKYMTELEENKKLVDLGIYDETLPRDVFLAYRSTDMEKVTELCNFLEGNGLTCFVSQRNLKHGRGAKNLYDERLNRAIDNCSVLVFVSSKKSRTEGDARKKELVYIRQKDIKRAPAEYAHNYAHMPKKYKMPRVEYLIERRSGMPNERFINEFFGGYQWRDSLQAVFDAVTEFLDGTESSVPEEEIKPQYKVKYCEQCGEENLISADYCCKCKSDRFVATYKEFLEIDKARKEAEIEARKRELEAQRKAEEERLAAEKAKLEAQQREIAATKANLKETVTREVQNSEKKRKAEERRYKRARSRQKAAEVFKKIFTYPFIGIWIALKYIGIGIGYAGKYVGKGIWFVLKYIGIGISYIGKGIWFVLKYIGKGIWIALKNTGIGIAKVCERMTDFCDDDIYMVTAIFAVPLLGLGLFNFIFPYTNPVAFPSYNGTVWIITCAVFFAVVLIALIISIGYLFVEQEGILAVVVLFIGLAAIGVFMLIGGLTHSMYGWAIGFAAAGGLVAIIAVFLLAEESPWSALLLIALYCFGLTLCGGLYALQKDIGVYRDNLYYEVRSDNTLKVYVDRYDMEELEIPSTINGYTVTSLGKPMRGGNNETLTNVTLPDTLLYIENKAFVNCEGLTSISIPDSVISIGDSVFKNCGLLEIDIPDGVEYIGKSAFENCRKMTRVKLPEKLTHIYKTTFKGCSALTDIILHEGITYVDGYAFENCVSMTKIIIPETVTGMGSDVFKGCSLLTIYCKPEKPGGWSGFWNWTSDWNSGRPVVWGYEGE